MKTAQRDQRDQRAQQHWQAGLAQVRQRQWHKALQEFEHAARLAPSQALYRINQSRALKALGRLDDAVAIARQALAIEPASPVACRMAAECLTLLHRHAEAVDCFAALPADAPRDHDFHAAYGNTLFLAGRQREAIDAFFQALALKMDSALVHYRMGLCFMDLAMKEEASECFRTATLLDDGGTRAMALALLVHESRQACRWEHLEDDTRALLDAIAGAREDDGQLLSPFALLAIDCTPEQQRQIGALRSRSLARGVRPLPARALVREPGRRIRVGYLSSDIYQHATAVLMAQLLERRDTERFEVVMYSHSRDDRSLLRSRVIAACDRFVDVSHDTNRAIAERIRADGIDILIDLKGHTRDSRYEVLALSTGAGAGELARLPGHDRRRLHRLRDRRPGGDAASACGALQRADRAASLVLSGRTTAIARCRRVRRARRWACRKTLWCCAASTRPTRSLRTCSTCGRACCSVCRMRCCGCWRGILRRSEICSLTWPSGAWRPIVWCSVRSATWKGIWLACAALISSSTRGLATRTRRRARRCGRGCRW